MEISAIDRSAQPSNVPAASIPVDQAAENREVVRAVKALNGTEMFGEENQLTFRRDPETQRMVVRVINRKTDEVVSQIPAEYVLRLAEDLKRTNFSNLSVPLVTNVDARLAWQLKELEKAEGGLASWVGGP